MLRRQPFFGYCLVPRSRLMEGSGLLGLDSQMPPPTRARQIVQRKMRLVNGHAPRRSALHV